MASDISGSRYKFIDLFAGMGGFHKALEELGAECVFASEMNPFARETYMKAFADSKVVRNHEDLFNIDLTSVTRRSITRRGAEIQSTDLDEQLTRQIEGAIEPFHVLCAGFPCQPFSHAGHKRGFDDVRGNLFFDIERILNVHEPDAIFLENVRNILSHDGNNTISVIKERLELAGYGEVFTPVVWASEHGLPQHRPRVFIIGFRNQVAREHFRANMPKPEALFLKRNPAGVPLKYTMSDVFGGHVTMKSPGSGKGAPTTRDIGFTLRVGGRMSPIKAKQNWDCYWVDGKETRLTPAHGLMMQGFTDSLAAGNGWFPASVNDTQAMKLLGNSVAVPAIRDYASVILGALHAAGTCPGKL